MDTGLNKSDPFSSDEAMVTMNGFRVNTLAIHRGLVTIGPGFKKLRNNSVSATINAGEGGANQNCGWNN
ncbi:hypothetical protein HPP92_003341 [Vanilla planifolia]|uniref:Uncharacterized protein n=1 Tax=Vanilla planifolia TaxID=51239 RepID=A0A835RU82_VANPL|nr:hypothetical protein HPP92_003341 [Vanilla planifolia]